MNITQLRELNTFEEIIIAAVLVFACWGLAHFVNSVMENVRRKRQDKKAEDALDQSIEALTELRKRMVADPVVPTPIVEAGTQGIQVTASHEVILTMPKEQFMQIVSDMHDAVKAHLTEENEKERGEAGLNAFEDFINKMDKGAK